MIISPNFQSSSDGGKATKWGGLRFHNFYFLSTQDYYGVTFPGTTATMPGRDGLANNPYSGKSNFMLKCSFFGVLFFYSLASLLIHVSCSTDWQITFFIYFTTVFCPGEATKFGRNDSSSPAPPTSLSTAGVQSQPQQAPQAGTQGQGQGQGQGQQTQNQAFLNPPLPPGYGYTGKEKDK